MADAKVTVGSVGISGHLMGYAYKQLDMANVIDSIDLYPANSGNFVFSGLDPDVYTFLVRDSPDGIALGTQIGGAYTIDVKDDTIEIEYKFYTVDGVGPNDPVSGADEITDVSLDGQNIQGVFKEGFRFLQKDLEYQIISGVTLKLLVGSTVAAFSSGEVFTIIIANIVPGTTTTSGLFAGSMLIDHDTTTDNNYLNKKTNCLSATNRLVITIGSIGSIPEGKFLYFTTFECNQYNTVFLMQGGEQIAGYGDRVILGRNEVLWMEKRSGRLEVLCEMKGVDTVGARSDETELNFINKLPENDALISKADYPRIWYYVNDKIPLASKIVTTDAAIATFNRNNGTIDASIPNRKAQFIVSPNFLRMPDTQNLYRRGLKNYVTYGTDATRSYDYPGGYQTDGVGRHWHSTGTQTEDGVTEYNKHTVKRVLAWSAPPVFVPKPSSTGENFSLAALLPQPAADETTVKSFGVIGMRNV